MMHDLLKPPTTPAPESWRSALRQDIHAIAFRFRYELDTPHYGPRAGSWVREAREAADAILDAAEAESWGTFCAQVIAGLEAQSDRWRGSEFSDPDGFGGSALGRFGSAVEAVKDQDFATACGTMKAAVEAREAKPIPRHDVYPMPPEWSAPKPQPITLPPCFLNSSDMVAGHVRMTGWPLSAPATERDRRPPSAPPPATIPAWEKSASG
ncbi:hypothetical protein [Magnetospirillum sp. 15-1]|uniref:hypothetical protein n=1 Tax=Magnetospirillum sp. 15-1 TaxID=1979370 RepID=UPI000BBBBB81|nr:hypothetical protein [Magnetospirillum sp. 15-1]